MIKWQVLISTSARKSFYSLNDKLQKRIRKGFIALKENPYRKRSGADILKLVGSFNPELYRLRIGDYRLIYSIQEKTVKITKIVLRKKAYKFLD